MSEPIRVRFQTGTGAASTTVNVAVPMGVGAAIFFPTGRTGGDGVTPRIPFAFGFAVGSGETDQCFVQLNTYDGQGAGLASQDDGMCGVVGDASGAGGGGGIFKVQSFPSSAGNVVLEIVDAFPASLEIEALFFPSDEGANYDLSIYSTGAGVSESGLGYTPTAAFLLSMAFNTLTSSLDNPVSFGWLTADGQAAIGYGLEHIASPNTNCEGIITTSRCLAAEEGPGRTVFGYSGAIQAGGFALTRQEGSGTHYIFVLTTDLPCKSGTGTMQTGTGEWDLATGLGITPTAALLMARQGVTASEGNTHSAGGAWSIGLLTRNGGSTQQGAITGLDPDALATRDVWHEVAGDAVLIASDRTGADTFAARYEVAAATTPFSAGSVRLNQVVASPAAELIVFIAFETGGSPPPPPTTKTAVEADMAVRVPYGQDVTVTFAPSTAGAKVSGISWAAGDVQLSQDHANFANATNTPAEIGSTGIYTLAVTAAEVTGDPGKAVLLKVFDAPTKTWDDLLISLETEGHPDAVFPQDTLAAGLLQAGSASGGTLPADAPATDLVGAAVYIIAGTGFGQQPRYIATYDTGTKAFTVTENWTVTPNTTSRVVVLPAAKGAPAAFVSAVQANLAMAAALQTVDDNVDAILADTGTDGVAISAATIDAIREAIATRQFDATKMAGMRLDDAIAFTLLAAAAALRDADTAAPRARNLDGAGGSADAITWSTDAAGRVTATFSTGAIR